MHALTVLDMCCDCGLHSHPPSPYRNSATGGTGATAVSNLHAIADDVFNFFANNVASSSRPLYFHTDDASLRNMFIYLNTAAGGSVNPKPTSMHFQVRAIDMLLAHYTAASWPGHATPFKFCLL